MPLAVDRADSDTAQQSAVICRGHLVPPMMEWRRTQRLDCLDQPPPPETEPQETEAGRTRDCP
eukprot:816101-Amphidinium_carterae.1